LETESSGEELGFSPLSINHESEISVKINENLLHSLCQKVYSGENVKNEKLVDLVFCSEETIKRINANYRKMDKITDVLSFTFNENDYLGEIYLCVKRADNQRIEYGLTLDEEIQRLFIHGLFHLLGFDHETEEERLKMEKNERKYVDFNN
jgi:probable rRNA maturation factor